MNGPEQSSTKASLTRASSTASTTSQAGPSRNRSKACLHCRRRKMRCDGVRPACFQCIRAERAGECEYDDGTTKTHTQLLYEKLQQLEKRFRELQANTGISNGRVLNRSNSNSGRPTMSVGKQSVPSTRSSSRQSFVFQHYDGGYAQATSRPGTSSSRHSHSGSSVTSHTPPSPLSSGMSHGSSLPSSHSVHDPDELDLLMQQNGQQPFPHTFGYGPPRPDAGFDFPYGHAREEVNQYMTHGIETMNVRETPNPSQVLPSMANPVLLPIFQGQEPSQEFARLLFEWALPHALQLGVTPFYSCVLGITRGEYPPPALQNASYLWGSHFAPDKSLRALEPIFLRRALSTLPDLLQLPQNRLGGFDQNLNEGTYDFEYNILSAIGASTLIANYFFAHGRTLEGAYHANQAMGLILCTGLQHTSLVLSRDHYSPMHTPNSRSFPVSAPLGTSGDQYYDQRAGCNSTMSTPSSPLDLLGPTNNPSASLRRLHTFWNTFVVERTWSASCGFPSSSSRWGMTPAGTTKSAITVPWPEDWDVNVTGDITQSAVPLNTALAGGKGLDSYIPGGSANTPLDDFLSGQDITSSNSVLQLRAKSAALFEAAARTADMRDPSTYGSMYAPPFATLYRTISIFIKRLPQLIPRHARSSSFLECSPFTTHTMAHASVIRLHFSLSQRAYEGEVMESFSGSVIRGGAVPPYKGVRAVYDSLLGYESVNSQYGAPPSHAANMPVDPGTVFEGVAAGVAAASVDKCVNAAHEVVKIVGFLAPEDFTYLEPVVSHCWLLAARVFIRELKRVTAVHSRGLTFNESTEKIKLVSALDVLRTGLKHLGAVFPIADSHAQQIGLMLQMHTGNGALA